MRTTSLVACAAALLSATTAINLVERRDAAPKVIHHEVQRRKVDNPLLRDQDRIRRRQLKTVSETLDNEETLYFANVSLGTPAQNLRLHIDTGSSDLWVNVASSPLCRSSGNPCGASGTYAPNSSTTYAYIDSIFNISYVDGSGSSGDYVSDVLRIGGATLQG
ncbi:hypothetical protein LTR66_011385, partial [Elasticomyces elasticus]